MAKKASTNPSHNMSDEGKKAMGAAAEARKLDALNPDHEVRLHYGYKRHKILWETSNEDDRHAIVYGMVVFDGMVKKGMQDIARFFGLKPEALKPYAETFAMAAMALKAKIQRNAISLGLQREDMVSLKFNLLLQYCEQVVNPSHEGVASQTDDKAVTINIVTKETLAAQAAIEEAPESAHGIKVIAIGPAFAYGA